MSTKRDLEAKDPQALLNRISSEFPDLRWHDFKFINHSWDHEVIILDNKWAFRFPNSSEYLEVFKNEPGLLQLIRSRSKTNIPDYAYVAKDRSFGGYALINGEELDEEKFLSLKGDQQSSLAIQLAEFLTAMHTIPIAGLKRYHIAEVGYSDDLAKLRRQVAEYLPNKLSSEDYAEVQSILEEVEITANHRPESVLIHHDLSGAHILWDNKVGTIGIIDFSDRSLGDPASDFAELFSYGEAFVDQIYKHYAGTKDPGLLKRARIYYKRVGVFLLVDSFLNDKISYDEAKVIFDRTKQLTT